MENKSLYHWGIKGMKWGRRRYQNKDGSLTPEGKKRYADDDGGSGEKKASTNPAKKKSVSEMTDDEINKAIERKKLEMRYNELYPEKISGGKAFVNSLINDVIKPAAKEAGKNLATNMLNKAVNKLTDDKIDPNSLEGMKKATEKLEAKLKLEKMKNTKWQDYGLSRDDQLKRQQYEKQAKDKEYDDLDRELKILKKRDEIEKYKQEQNDRNISVRETDRDLEDAYNAYFTERGKYYLQQP